MRNRRIALLYGFFAHIVLPVKCLALAIPDMARVQALDRAFTWNSNAL